MSTTIDLARPLPCDADGLVEPQAFAAMLGAMLRHGYAVAPPVLAPIEHLLQTPGKALRPSLAAAVAEAYDLPATDGVFAVAAAGELIHAASLMHDDIMDAARQRRGRAAVHAAFDEPTAALAGDVLLGVAMDLLAQAASEATLRIMGAAFYELASAQALETRLRGQPLQPEQAGTIARGKTGALFGWIAAAVACEARADDAAAAWNAWGHDFGLAFQLADDLGDRLHLDEGKPSGLDAANGVGSLVDALATSTSTLSDEAAALCRRLDTPPCRAPSLDRLIATVQVRLNERLRRWLGRGPSSDGHAPARWEPAR